MTNNSNDLSLEEIIQKGVKLTPMMDQYYNIKKDYPGILMMFRMGDFYELFFDDARKASRILNISLTHRGKLGGYPIPMSGIPHHAATTYIDRMTSVGEKVAICEQIQNPKDAIGIVKRAVTQVVSPGMPYDLDKSESTQNSYMCCLHQTNENTFNVVMVDFTTGDFFGLNLKSLSAALEKIQLYRPKEMITFLGQWNDTKQVQDYLNASGILVTHLSAEYFEEKHAGIYIEKLIPTYKRDQVIKLHDGILKPIGALSYYICSTQSLENLTHIRPFSMVNTEADMKITYPTLVGLEIFPKTRETYKDSILGFIDSTKTAMGTRKLKAVFQNPLRSEPLIQKRLDGVQILMDDFSSLKKLRSTLGDIRDIERIMAKVSTGKVNGPDLINLAKAHTSNTEMANNLKNLPKDLISKFSKDEKTTLINLEKKIYNTINDQIGATLEKGNLIKTGCHKERDRLSKLNNNAVDALVELETKYRKQTGISNLKVKSNNVAGYFIEVSKSHVSKVPESFTRRQTLVNSERYQNPELADFEKELICAKDKLYKLERKIFDDLVNDVKAASQTVLRLADNLSFIDVLQSFAWVSKQEGFSRAVISKKKLLNIHQAWHPLIKSAIQDQFVNHDLVLDEQKYFGLITGPNMAGKTTVMREMAIIQFLNQIGCFVPAQKAEVGIVDYIFSRLGASDDIIKGQSTFMVEMSETAEIIRHASEDSLIILDEIGRGTSTYDGLSIAWSLVEYFVKTTKALTLFSTHYHELIELVEGLENAKNLTVKTINEKGNVQFLYQLIEQGATQSFGIHVAKLAGLPAEILNRSSQILATLESDQETTTMPVANPDISQLDMFNVSAEIVYEDSELKLELEKIDVLNMTPIQALQKLHELQSDFLM